MFNLIIAAALQGVLEWLPVSSEGIVTLSLGFLNYSFKEGMNIALFLHLGTLIASLSFFRQEIFAFFKLKKKNLLSFVLLSGIVSSLLGLPAYLFLQEINFNHVLGQALIGSALMITGFLQLKRKEKGERQAKSINKKDGLLTGLAQAFSVLPGISRSGITTIILNWRGFDIKNALKLSFLCGIIPIFGAQLFTGLKEGFFFQPKYLILTLVSFIVGRISIGYLLEVAERINFGKFCLFFGFLNIILIFFI